MSILIAGVDEVGIGCLAGPVYAAAVIFHPDKKIYKLRDSKMLTAKEREYLAARIYAKALAVSIGQASVEEIDQLNIYHANLLAMQRAIAGLTVQPQHVLIDGKAKPIIDLSIETIVGGDRLVPVISAASIIAKVARDQVMTALPEEFAHYKFASHKGYATKMHVQLLRKYGPCVLHRHAFIKKYFPSSTDDNPTIG